MIPSETLRLMFAYLLTFALKIQSGRLARRTAKDMNHFRHLTSSTIPEQVRDQYLATECWRQKFAVLQSEVEVNRLGTRAEWQKEAFHRLDLLRSELESLRKHREELQPLALVFLQCELDPLRTRVERTLDLLNGLQHRINYLKLWLTHQVTAPALEVLLYMCLPISHVESIAGDLEEEYRCVHVPTLGPQAARWWYTKQVLATVFHYFIRIVKHASLFASGMALLMRLWAWIIRLHSH
jgi:hypothetical protein